LINDRIFDAGEFEPGQASRQNLSGLETEPSMIPVAAIAVRLDKSRTEAPRRAGDNGDFLFNVHHIEFLYPLSIGRGSAGVEH
jgi:hypothetical protein